MKEFILDIQIVLNSNVFINLEIKAWDAEREQLLAKLAEYETKNTSSK